MGTPAQQGNPAGSAAQHAGKAFPAGTDPSSITMVSGLPDAHPTAVGSPVQPDIRQVRPIPQMGMGYREADPETDAW